MTEQPKDDTVYFLLFLLSCVLAILSAISTIYGLVKSLDNVVLSNNGTVWILTGIVAAVLSVSTMLYANNFKPKK